MLPLTSHNQKYPFLYPYYCVKKRLYSKNDLDKKQTGKGIFMQKFDEDRI